MSALHIKFSIECMWLINLLNADSFHIRYSRHPCDQLITEELIFGGPLNTFLLYHNTSELEKSLVTIG